MKDVSVGDIVNVNGILYKVEEYSGLDGQCGKCDFKQGDYGCISHKCLSYDWKTKFIFKKQ